MIKVAVFTSTRAEYGLLCHLLRMLEDSPEFELQLIVSGTHLSHEFGYTVDEILRDGFSPFLRIPSMISDDSPQAVTKSAALLSMSLADYFATESPEFFVLLGDRYELLAAGAAAMMAKVPIVHIHGGESTEGAVDEKVRHALTKLSSLHFTSTEAYRRRVIQMGESPEHVVNCGALGLEGLRQMPLPELSELAEQFGIDPNRKYFLVVYHPETNKESEDISDLIRVLAEYDDYDNVFIYPNSDIMSRGIIRSIEDYRSLHPDRVHIVRSTSRRNYLALVKHCSLYIGNSSSGVIEVPSFQRPIVNIGDRQKGRIRASSVIDSTLSANMLRKSVDHALSPAYQAQLPEIRNPYEGDMPSAVILDTLREMSGRIRIDKSFIDLGVVP